jgi:hypothetical protein
LKTADIARWGATYAVIGRLRTMDAGGTTGMYTYNPSVQVHP